MSDIQGECLKLSGGLVDTNIKTRNNLPVILLLHIYLEEEGGHLLVRGGRADQQ